MAKPSSKSISESLKLPASCSDAPLLSGVMRVDKRDLPAEISEDSGFIAPVYLKSIEELTGIR